MRHAAIYLTAICAGTSGAYASNDMAADATLQGATVRFDISVQGGWSCTGRTAAVATSKSSTYSVTPKHSRLTCTDGTPAIARAIPDPARKECPAHREWAISFNHTLQGRADLRVREN